MSIFSKSKHYPSFYSFEEDFFEVARISRTHGYKGDVILIFKNRDHVQLCKKKHPLFLKLEGKLVPYFFETSVIHKPNELCVRFEDLELEHQLPSMIGTTIYLSKKVLPKSERDKFNYQDFIGFEVVDTKFDHIGTVMAFREYPIQSLLEISTLKKTALIPMVDEFIVEIQHKQRKIIVSLPEGLLDI